ncbi:hypothetical protein [Sinorhizobium meliloti]|jgi:hypothetical protein|uniref:Uncharacterized protein n=1 Tax=Rhizobium meliloti TaxID=382 RepID=A0A6A7ZU45_RHIML|nr:hypothetical protein [Sinorhizobium meliloti]MCO5962975.1 hypothetical protein [Sinorhizobium meliloti]MDE3820846.1 hypothetical protein [Sinorhizobium meliloti]MDE4549878.1 hypothetical protein [Sinorhizobium meliloti]MDE4570167.1 hypothetical protein [Sinorhizobium meliloti]MDE4588976.1 hypothetical protein [Sinorhizobium meliloti]
MALSDYGRNTTVSEACFRTITHPLTNLICIIVAVSIAAFASVPTGIPPYMLAPIGFMLVILIDPAGIASRLKARSGRQGATAGRSESVADGWQASGNGWSLTFQRKRGLTRGAARSIIAAAARERAADSCRR